MNEINNNPELIFTELFLNGEDSILTYILKNNNIFGDVENKCNIFLFQDYIYNILINFLNKKISGCSFVYDKEIYPSLIFVCYKDREIASLDIYNHCCNILENKEVLKKVEELEKIKNDILKNDKELDFYSNAQKNTSLFLNGEVLNYIKVKTNKKKYKKEALNKYKEFSDISLSLEIERNSLINDIKNIKRRDIEYVIYKEKIESYLKNNFKYTVNLPNDINI